MITSYPIYIKYIKNTPDNQTDATFGILQPPSISQNQQQEEIQSLSETVRYERSFFVVDANNQTIRFPMGISMWLGYPEDEFTLPLYNSLIHHHHLSPSMLFTKVIFEMIKSKQLEIDSTQRKFVSRMAIKHSAGHYLLVKRTITCWELEKENNDVQSYLNEFTIWGEYDSETLNGIRPRITDLFGTRMFQLEDLLKEYIYQELEKEKRFSIQELRILRKYAYNKDLATQDIASAFKISYNTVNTHNRKIIEKFSNIYANNNIKSAKEIAQFLREENFI